MKLLFNKIDFNGQWFHDNEYPKEFTDKVPPDTGYIFNDELDMWELPPVEEEEDIIEEDIENGSSAY